jgi:hypothetical protein
MVTLHRYKPTPHKQEDKLSIRKKGINESFVTILVEHVMNVI